MDNHGHLGDITAVQCIDRSEKNEESHVGIRIANSPKTQRRIHENRSRILARIHQMRKRIPRIPVSTNTLKETPNRRERRTKPQHPRVTRITLRRRQRIPIFCIKTKEQGDVGERVNQRIVLIPEKKVAEFNGEESRK
jgi:hypothetical protein